MKGLLKTLTDAFGPSGCESEVLKIIRDNLNKYGSESTEIITDKLGGIYFHVKNEGAPKLMLCAHMDEVGFMVTGITDSGLLRFGTVGGVDPIILGSKEVVSESGAHGIIISKPIHLQSVEERARRPEIKDMYIDVGATDKETAQKYAHIGDYFTFGGDFTEMAGGQIKAKALDDRHGCTAMLGVIKQLAENDGKSPYDLYFAFTTREEVSYSGAWCAAEMIKPDYAIVIESKAVLDLPEVPDTKRVAVLGDGALISYADCGAIMDRALTDKLISVCEKNGIKYQINRAVSGGNDTGTFQRGAYGARVALVSAPSRYIHSGASVINYSDFECIVKALYSFVTDGGKIND